ncbi:hypothetical protein C7M84_001373 [Penaeus vannamei]|uniref:Uncharacterized protein n=1 Tax=Penaeus vannamei TaxID=6689 RepID=A0A3R7SXE1_PENVA|nr:hypothetical protein C7M84_001373 [Penaeus vannamei]
MRVGVVPVVRSEYQAGEEMGGIGEVFDSGVLESQSLPLSPQMLAHSWFLKGFLLLVAAAALSVLLRQGKVLQIPYAAPNPVRAVLLEELRQDIASPVSAINLKLAAMQSQIDQQASVIKHQQQFLEAVDRRERETKLVILGVPDEGEDLAGATTDENKIRKIWSVIGEEVRIRGHRRLGRRDANSTRKRPILVEVETKQVRDGVLSKAKKLKEEDQTYGRIYIKKDVHPCVRNEWKRVREAEKNERERPGNVGSVNGSKLRGGTTVLVRRSLHTSVLRVDTSSPDQGLYKYLHRPCSRPGVATVGVYGGRAVRVLIHTALRLSVLQPSIVWRCTGEDQVSHCDDESCDSRDMNARFGTSVRDLPRDADIPGAHLYT